MKSACVAYQLSLVPYRVSALFTWSGAKTVIGVIMAFCIMGCHNTTIFGILNLSGSGQGTIAG